MYWSVSFSASGPRCWVLYSSGCSGGSRGLRYTEGFQYQYEGYMAKILLVNRRPSMNVLYHSGALMFNRSKNISRTISWKEDVNFSQYDLQKCIYSRVEGRYSKGVDDRFNRPLILHAEIHQPWLGSGTMVIANRLRHTTPCSQHQLYHFRTASHSISMVGTTAIGIRYRQEGYLTNSKS